MYSLLIVDDEIIAIQGIEAGIHWSDIGISPVLKAYNARQAREIFARERVDILLSDIEMPQENGLKLLEWVKQSYPETETVILTCHTDFSYARKALQLGSSDYALKSMSYEELESVIAKAAERVEANRSRARTTELGALWRRNRKPLLERFWSGIASGETMPGEEDFARLGAEGGRAVTLRTRFIPVLLQAFARREAAGGAAAGRKELLEGIRDLAERILKADGENGYLVTMDASRVLCILRADAQAEPNAWRALLRRFSREYGEKFKAGISCYVGDETEPAGLAGVVAALTEMQKDNVALQEGVFELSHKEHKPAEPESGTAQQCLPILMEESFDRFVEELTACFNGLVKSEKINAAMLKQFHQDFLQTLYSLLNQRGIQAHLLFSDPFSINLFDHATDSVYDMLEWVRHTVLRIQDYIEKQEDSMSVVDKVRRYISLHLDEEPGRDDIANYVYLNPDYLTRLFKKKTGQTLSEYIQTARMQSAKELLEKSDLNVSKIAEKLGYSNFSHFARMFRKNTGISPMEYRKNRKGGAGRER